MVQSNWILSARCGKARSQPRFAAAWIRSQLGKSMVTSELATVAKTGSLRLPRRERSGKRKKPARR